MNSYPLKKYADYVSEKISTNQLNVSDYVTTDNILQNKQGITLASSLPTQSGKVTKYRTGDILLANIRPYLKKIWFSQKTGGCSADVLAFRAKENINPNFLYYALFRDDFFNHVMNGAKGTKMPRGDKTQIMEFSIPEFDKNIQNKIAQTLSCLDKKIELNNRINAELEAMAKTLYDYWFVQFDFPNAKGNPYKTAGGKMVYNPTLKREIPEGWVQTTIGKISKTELGGTPSTTTDEYWNNASIPWLSSAEVASFPVISSEQMITHSGIENSAAVLLPKGTVVISIVRYIRPSILGIDAATNQSVVGIRECNKLKNSFLYPYFCSEVPRLMGLRTGAQQPHINKGVIDDSPIVIPIESVLKDYYQIAQPIFEKIMNLAFQNLELISLRDWLLPMLMNGQVTIKD